MAMRLSIGSEVTFPVKFSVQNGAESVEHEFALTFERPSMETLTGKDPQNQSKLISETLIEFAKGWSGQKIVVDDSGKPVDFSGEAFQVLLTLPMVANIIYKEFFLACGARAKN